MNLTDGIPTARTLAHYAIVIVALNDVLSSHELPNAPPLSANMLDKSRGMLVSALKPVLSNPPQGV